MSGQDVKKSLLDQFRDSGADRHLTLLLGAGASTSSGLPGWDELAVRLLIRSRSVKDRKTAELLVEQQDPLLVAEAARRAKGANWNRMVRAALYEGVAEPDPSTLHIAAAGHLLAGTSGDTTLLTLNFDTLLESAIRLGTSQRVESRSDGSRLPGGYVVHHLHGIVDTEVRDVILTLSDFNELLGSAESWQQRLIGEAVSTGALIIAGTSFRDPDLRRWLHVAMKNKPPENSALVLLARQGYKLSRTEFEVVKKPLAEQWSSIGLTPIILEDFTDAAQIIRELRHIDESGYRSPHERATSIWRAHRDDFDALQKEYSDQLASNAAVLRGAFNVDQLNTTLWLADGDGRLARWAAHDRLYRSGDDLRLVESGHDSHWIAGRALGSEEMLFQDLGEQGTQRWSTVLAVPLRVEHLDLPEFATAVLSVGLPGAAEDYGPTEASWINSVAEIANDWSRRLVEASTRGMVY